MNTTLIWPWPVRVAHGLLAACVLGALWLHEGGALHQALGWCALAVAVLRVVAGWVAKPPQLRFAHFVHGPRATWAYARQAWRGLEARHLGHNPLGGWMIVALLACAVLAGASGALYDTDRFWGDPLVYGVHQVAGWSFALLVPLHVAGVVFTSWRHRENLLAAMVTGHKRPAGPGDES